jgi:hypothetical protein
LVKSSSIIELGIVYLTRYGDVDADAKTPVVVVAVVVVVVVG